MTTAPTDPWATDTADPAKIFRAMFPLRPERLDWRVFSVRSDIRLLGRPSMLAKTPVEAVVAAMAEAT
jgi:hypothetical protein